MYKRPKKRKSPYKHHVREHLRRNGKGNLRPVRDYDRGKGDKPAPKPRRRRVVVSGSKSSANPSGAVYGVVIYYPDYKSERLDIDAKDYRGALAGGLERRDITEPPKLVRIRRRRV